MCGKGQHLSSMPQRVELWQMFTKAAAPSSRSVIGNVNTSSPGPQHEHRHPECLKIPASHSSVSCSEVLGSAPRGIGELSEHRLKSFSDLPLSIVDRSFHAQTRRGFKDA